MSVDVLSTVPTINSSQTISEFCISENISKFLYFRLKREGRAPREMRPGGRIVRITAEARRDWHLLMEAEARAQATGLERQRYAEQSRTAGRLAAASPAHVSQRGRTAKGRRA